MTRREQVYIRVTRRKRTFASDQEIAYGKTDATASDVYRFSHRSLSVNCPISSSHYDNTCHERNSFCLVVVTPSTTELIAHSFQMNIVQTQSVWDSKRWFQLLIHFSYSDSYRTGFKDFLIFFTLKFLTFLIYDRLQKHLKISVIHKN